MRRARAKQPSQGCVRAKICRTNAAIRGEKWGLRFLEGMEIRTKTEPQSVAFARKTSVLLWTESVGRRAGTLVTRRDETQRNNDSREVNFPRVRMPTTAWP